MLRSGRFRPLLNTIELMVPILFERGRPGMHRTQSFGVGAVKLLAFLAAQVHKARCAQDA